MTLSLLCKRQLFAPAPTIERNILRASNPCSGEGLIISETSLLAAPLHLLLAAKNKTALRRPQ